MSVVKDLVTNSLKYYDSVSHVHAKLFKKAQFCRFVYNDTDMSRNEIILYDKNKVELYRSQYESLGKYHGDSQVWVWGWANPIHKKNLIVVSKKLLYYGLDIDPTQDNIDLKTELITSRFQITDPIQLDIHVAIAAYLSKNTNIFRLIIIDDAGYFNTTDKTVAMQDYKKISHELTGTSDAHYLYLFNQKTGG